MPMPLRNSLSDYRYAYQGQEKDPETGKEAFQLRLWDARIGRWLSTDPYGQYHSPYLGMGNNPINGVDPDGGLFGWIRAKSKQLFKGGEVWKNDSGEWNWKRGFTTSAHGTGDGDLNQINIETKNFGLGGFGKLNTLSSEASFSGKLDFGLLNINRDYGLVGYKVKAFTYDLTSFKIGRKYDNVSKQYSSIEEYYNIGIDPTKGTIFSATVETGPYGDYGFSQKYDNGNKAKPVTHKGTIGWTIIRANISQMTSKGVHFNIKIHEDIGGGTFLTGKLQVEAKSEYYWQF